MRPPAEPSPQVAIITGASSGIGRATALALAGARRAHVALAARNAAQLGQVAAEVEALGGQALVAPTDVTERDQVRRLVAGTIARFGRVDVVVANAGAYIRGRAADLGPEAFERSMAVNFYGGLYLATETLPHLLRQGSGHLIFITSMDAKKGLPLDAPYVAAKAALTGYAEVLRQELHGTGVYVTTILPGRIDTAMIDHLDVPAISAKIPPEAVARSVVRALRTHPAEVILPPQAKLLNYLNVFSPRLGDWAARTFHLEGRERAGRPVGHGS